MINNIKAASCTGSQTKSESKPGVKYVSAVQVLDVPAHVSTPIPSIPCHEPDVLPALSPHPSVEGLLPLSSCLLSCSIFYSVNPTTNKQIRPSPYFNFVDINRKYSRKGEGEPTHDELQAVHPRSSDRSLPGSSIVLLSSASSIAITLRSQTEPHNLPLFHEPRLHHAQLHR